LNPADAKAPQTKDSDSFPPSVLVRLGGDTVAAIREFASGEINSRSRHIETSYFIAMDTIGRVARDLAAAEPAEPHTCAHGYDDKYRYLCADCFNGGYRPYLRAPSTNTPTNHVHNAGQPCPCDGCDW
jgi:hypothetical protein